MLVLGAILLLLVPLLSTSDAAFAHLVARVVPDWLHNISFGRILEVAIWTIFYIIVV